MKRVISAVICLLLMCLILSACGQKMETEGSGSMESDVTETFEIQTPNCILRYPVKWQNAVTIQPDADNENILRFIAGDTPLFDLLFDQPDGDVLGTIQDNDQNIVLRIKTYDVPETAENYNDLCAMQEDVNVILQNLSVDYHFTSGLEIPVVDDAVFEVETPVTKLYYPERWKDSVQVQLLEKGASFSCGEVKLFDIIFEQSDGTIILGSYHDTPVCLVAYDLDPASLSPEDYNRLSAMQEDVNVILQHLREDPAFQPAEP